MGLAFPLGVAGVTRGSIASFRRHLKLAIKIAIALPKTTKAFVFVY